MEKNPLYTYVMVDRVTVIVKLLNCKYYIATYIQELTFKRLWVVTYRQLI